MRNSWEKRKRRGIGPSPLPFSVPFSHAPRAESSPLPCYQLVPALSRRLRPAKYKLGINRAASVAFTYDLFGLDGRPLYPLWFLFSAGQEISRRASRTPWSLPYSFVFLGVAFIGQSTHWATYHRPRHRYCRALRYVSGVISRFIIVPPQFGTRSATC